MSEKYSLAEIDRMRQAVRNSYDAHVISGPGSCYRESERSAEIENRVRTYMAGGIRAEEIEAKNSAIFREAYTWHLKRRAETAVKAANEAAK